MPVDGSGLGRLNQREVLPALSPEWEPGRRVTGLERPSPREPARAIRDARGRSIPEDADSERPFVRAVVDAVVPPVDRADVGESRQDVRLLAPAFSGARK